MSSVRDQINVIPGDDGQDLEDEVVDPSTVMEEMEQVMDENEKLRAEIDDLNREILALRDYQNKDLNTKNSSDSIAIENKIKSSLSSFPSIATGRQLMYSATKMCRPSWMPVHVYNNVRYNDMYQSTNCIGCGELILKARSKDYRYSLNYLVHLIEFCEDYKKMNLITECLDCNYKFINSKGYNSHRKRVHFETVGHKCSICDKEFVKKSYLDRHSVTHTGHKPFKCSKCGIKFTRNSSLNDHVKRKVCVFKRRNWPRIESSHSLKHARAKPFKCSKCGTKFTRKSSLNDHVKEKVCIMKRRTRAKGKSSTATIKNSSRGKLN